MIWSPESVLSSLPFVKGMPVVELERLLLLREFQELLHHAQPERDWNLQVGLRRKKLKLIQWFMVHDCRRPKIS